MGDDPTGAFDGVVYLFITMAVAGAVLVPLGAWKLIELIMWICGA